MLVCVFVCVLCTRDRGCSAHPVFPAPSDFMGGDSQHASGATRREIAELHLLILPFITIGVILRSTSDAQAPPENQGRGTHMKLWRIGVIMGAWLMFAAAPIAAQDSFPSRPVRIVIPYSPGSVADVFARIVAQNMAVQWNGSIVAESKP